MLSIGLIILISIDFILLKYGNYKLYYVFIKNIINSFKEKNKEQLNTTDNSLETTSNAIIEDIDVLAFSYKKSRLNKIGMFLLKLIGILFGVLFILAIFLIIIGIATSSIWGTILLAIYKNFIYAAVFLIAIKLLYFLLGLGMHKLLKVDKSVTQRVLIMDTIQFTMLAILLYFAAFGFPIQVKDMVIVPYEWNITFNNLTSIILPMIFFSLIIINILSVVLRINNVFTKDRNKHKLLRFHQLLFIFIGSCFFGILYITEIDLSFMSEVERIMYLHTLEVVKWIITSVFIPLFLFTLNNYNKVKKIN